MGGFYAENVANLREHMKEEMGKGKTSWKRSQRESGWDGTYGKKKKKIREVESQDNTKNTNRRRKNRKKTHLAYESEIRRTNGAATLAYL